MVNGKSAAASVLVVDDDAGMRALVVEALREDGFATCEAVDAVGALDAVRNNGIDAVILDVNLQGTSGYEVCRRVKDDRPDVSVIFLSGERTESFDKVAGLLLGADDYIAKPFAPDELVARLRAVLRRTTPPVPARMHSLTHRELEVLRLLANGRTQKDIAGDLVISPKTVGTHIERILEKLGVRSRAQAIAVAYQDNLVAGT